MVSVSKVYGNNNSWQILASFMRPTYSKSNDLLFSKVD